MVFELAKILVIEDNENLRYLFQGFLTDAGHDVIIAENGAMGLKILQTEPLPDIILLDLIMPDMDGCTVAKLIYSNDRFSNIPIMVISGATDEKAVHKVLYDSYISKPFDLDEVLSEIDRLTNPRLVNS